MSNIKLILEYDGTEYAGWQRQDNAVTVQQVLEEALHRLTGEDISVIASSRTDSGVHARGQTVNFHTSSRIPPEKYSFALNALLPPDIRVVSSERVPDDFHSRYWAKGKKYKYCMVVGPHGTAIGHRYYAHITPPLDIEAMERSCRHFIGTHDFAAFRSTGSPVKSTVRTIFEAELERDGRYLYFIVKGDGFLYNMVRIMAGTLIYVGKGKIKPDEIPDILLSRDRKRAGITAPAHGLFLEEVYY